MNETRRKKSQTHRAIQAFSSLVMRSRSLSPHFFHNKRIEVVYFHGISHLNDTFDIYTYLMLYEKDGNTDWGRVRAEFDSLIAVNSWEKRRESFFFIAITYNTQSGVSVSL